MELNAVRDRNKGSMSEAFDLRQQGVSRCVEITLALHEYPVGERIRNFALGVHNRVVFDRCDNPRRTV